MKYLIAVIICIGGCFTIKSPEIPQIPPMPTAPGSPVSPIGPAGFDWQTLIAYVASIAAGVVAFIRWIIIEFKHRKLVNAGKKDANRDGEEDK